MSSALRDPSHGILNFRHGGGQSLQPPTNPADHNHQPFEWRQAVGPDESCTLVKQGSGLYAAKSPNGRSWVSRQPDGSLQERATSDPSQPGPWETGPYDPSTHAWTPPHGGPFTVEGDQPNGGGGGGGPVGPEHGFIRTGPGDKHPFHDFLDESGQPWLLAAYAMHTLISNVAKGDDIAPLLDDAVELGYNTILTIGTHLSPWKRDNGFYCDPRDSEHPDRIRHIFDVCASRGLRVFYHALADCQHGLSDSEQHHVTEQAQDASRGRWNVFYSTGNESGANGWDPAGFPRPQNMGGVLCCTGSAGENTPPYGKYWDLIIWEGRSDIHAPHKAFDDAGAGSLELQWGYTGDKGKVGPFPCVLFQGEPPRFNDVTPDRYGDDRWTDPALALRLGLNIAGNAGGGTFLATDGMVCQKLQDRAKECGRQFIRGLRGAFLR